MVMRSKQRLGTKLTQVLGNSPRDAKAIVGRCPTPDFIEDDQAPFRCVVENLGSLSHLHHKRRLTTREVIVCTNASKNAIHNSDMRCIRRNKRTNLRKQHNQRNLSQDRGLTSGIRTGDHMHRLFGVENRVIRDEALDSPGKLFNHRMPPSRDRNDIPVIHNRPAPPVIHRELCERSCDIELRNHPRTVKYTPRPVSRNHLPQNYKQFTLTGNQPVLRSHHLRFHFLELRGEVTLTSGRRLFPDVILRDELQL